MAQRPIRVRRRVADPESLDPVVVRHLEEQFGGIFPTEPAAQLSFIHTHFSDRAHLGQRHALMDLLLRQGKSVPEIAIMLRKGERTIWRWKSELAEHHSQAFTLMDVREIHARRMADLYQAQCELDAIAYDRNMPVDARMTAFRTKVRVHAIHDQILRQAGYYRAFDLGRESARCPMLERSPSGAPGRALRGWRCPADTRATQRPPAPGYGAP